VLSKDRRPARARVCVLANRQIQEAELPQRDRATRYLRKFVLCFTSNGVRKVSNSKSDLQGHSRGLVMIPFDESHTISYSY